MRASRRRKVNKICGLEDETGNWKTTDSEMEGISTEYFQVLFQSSNPMLENIDLILDSIPSSISEEQNAHLTRSFTREEIGGVIKKMHPTKAPGPDGMQAIFYQKYWDIVGEDVSNYCLDFLNGEASLHEINKTNIVLIPKVKDPKSMKDFRPISLCSVLYKVIAKTLANRMKQVLGLIISPSQSVFVPRHLILDNTILVFERTHTVKNKRKGKEGVAALKLDMSKAYDGVE